MRNTKKYINKKLNKKKKTRKKTRKHRNQKMIKGGNIIGQGTHGTITVDTSDMNFVIKSYNKVQMNNCDMLQNEYNIQQQLFGIFDNIYVPKCCCFVEQSSTCSYKMERIFNLSNLDYFIILNMQYEGDDIKRFIHSSNAYEAGANYLQKITNVNDMCFSIGKMFSKLHYELCLDGYDCELIYGNIREESRLCLIDFDKINYFEWKLGYKTYRKLDERTIDTKELVSVNKFAWYLFGALISMSLVPKNEDLRNIFITGYSSHVDKNNELQNKVFEEIVNLINEYV
jgi:hypothetical protein